MGETDLTDKLRLEGLLTETFSRMIVCPVPGCSARFSFVQSFRDHLHNHGMVKEKITETVEEHLNQSKSTNESVLKAMSEHTGLVREAQGPTKHICFMNSSLQFLRRCSLDKFLNQVERIEGNSYEICDILLNLLTCKTSTATELRETFATEFGDDWNSTWNGKDWEAPQQCAAEFLTYLFQLIRRETFTDISEYEHVFEELKERTFIDVEKEKEGPCSNCKTYPSQTIVQSDFVFLELEGCGDKVELSTLLNQQFINKKSNKIEMKCSTCCTHENNCPVTGICAMKPAIERTTPLLNKYIFVMIKRFITHDSPKLVTNIKISQKISLDGVEYEPVASLEHLGDDMDSGHYITYTKVQDQIWLKLDDVTSSVTKLSEVGKDAYIVMLQRTGKQDRSGNVESGIVEQRVAKNVEAQKRSNSGVGVSVSVRRGQESPGFLSECPKCNGKGFSRRQSVLRHLKKVHNLSKSELDKCMKKVKTCLEYCNTCKQFTSNHARHKKTCKGTAKQVQVEKQNCPQKLARKGLKLLECFRIWLESVPFNLKTIRSYCNSLKNFVIPFWELNVENFLADGLLHPLDSNTPLPSISSYVNEASNDSNALRATKAYLSLLHFLQERFTSTYSGDLRREEKMMWKVDLEDNRTLAKNFMQRKNRTVKERAQVKVSQKIQSGTDLSYNQDRMKVVMADIINSEKINGLLQKIAEDEDNSNHFEEFYLRNFLAFIVLFYSAGKRADAITNLTVGALNGATWDGSAWTARVDKHKTMKSYGAALVIIQPTTYKCLKNYVRLFPATEGTKETDLVFRTMNDTPVRMNDILEHSKEWVLDFVTEEEFKSFNAKAIRKGWINLAESHPDRSVRELAVKLHDHSEKVRRSHYSQTRNADMVSTVQSLVSHIRREEEHEEELSVPIVEEVDMEKNEESTDRAKTRENRSDRAEISRKRTERRTVNDPSGPVVEEVELEKDKVSTQRANTTRMRTERKTRKDSILTESDKSYLRQMLTKYPDAKFIEAHREDSRFMEILNRVHERKKKGTAINPLRAALACINEVRRLRIVKKVKRSVTRDEGSEEDMSDDKFCEDESSETEKDSESDNEDIMPHKVLTPGCYKSDSEDKKKDERDSSGCNSSSSDSIDSFNSHV